MGQLQHIPLDGRGAVTVAGADRAGFLQGLLSNDIARVGGDRVVWAALLTPQGKYRHDVFVAEIGGSYYLDCEAGERMMDLGRTLNRFKLRADVKLGIAQGWRVTAVVGDGAARVLGLPEQAPGAARSFAGGIAFVDPRLPAAGLRLLTPDDPSDDLTALGAEPGTLDDYDSVRIPLGLPDGSRDMAVDKAILLENGFDELDGVDWKKGCFMGQELTARTKYRGLVKKRLLPVAIEGPSPAPGDRISCGGREAGEVRSVAGGHALALLRLDRLAPESPVLQAGPAVLHPVIPEWFELPEAQNA